jgi:hypothetical protein
VRFGTCWGIMPAQRKLVGGMFLLVALGAALMLPPLVYVFNQPLDVFGVPLIVFYLFGVWFLLIVGTAALTRAMPPDRSGEEPPEG